MSANYLHIDIETYSSVSLKDCGVYRYVESIDFEILILAYALNDGPIAIVSLATGEEIPEEFFTYYQDPTIRKYAHNATFERTCLNAYFHGMYSDELLLGPEAWHCTMVLAGYCGLPLSLLGCSTELNLNEDGKAKSTAGKALIRYFCIPCKPTKSNGQRYRNLPYHAPEKWQAFLSYCGQDVEAERAVHKALSFEHMTLEERNMYVLDQKINDTGVEIDITMCKSAIKLDQRYKRVLIQKMRNITGLQNPNSQQQLTKWLTAALKKPINSLAKASIEKLLLEVDSGAVRDVLELRKKAAKTSITKYGAMINYASVHDKRARGTLQFYGASRTGRWSGRGVQPQNMTRNYLKQLSFARGLVRKADYDMLHMLYDDAASTLSQLIRTAIVAKKSCTFAVADFSAIEARVLAWLAGEEWRLEVFRTHGKIYEASAANMFNMPIEACTKEADYKNKTKYRETGKIAELALGYQGSIGALDSMAKQQNSEYLLNLPEEKRKAIVHKWRRANKNIGKFWDRVNLCMLRALKTRKPVTGPKGLVFQYEHNALTIRLLNGRKLYYDKPRFAKNRWGRTCIEYRGTHPVTKKWAYINTYGGKITENLAQAIARDLLAYAMIKLDRNGYRICMHVHDEAICEVPIKGAEEALEEMTDIMAAGPPWAKGLPLNADGYLTPFYKKD